VWSFLRETAQARQALLLPAPPGDENGASQQRPARSRRPAP